jgi:tetratricopeptide (TPR) repeat protein
VSGVAHISELELPRNPDRPEWPKWAIVRLHFGIQGFGVNAWTSVEESDQLIGEHDELGERGARHEELYFVANGRARFTVAGDEFDAPTGTFVFVRDPAAKRAAVAKEPGTTVIVVGGRPGGAFTPSPWERSGRAFGYWATGDFDKAIEALSEAHAEWPDDGSILFNLACAESRAGRRHDAVTHLRQAIELGEQFRELAEEDVDFDPIRDDPEFQSVLAGKAGARSSSS